MFQLTLSIQCCFQYHLDHCEATARCFPLLIAESLIERVVALESHVVCWIVHVPTNFVNSMLFSVPFGSLWSYCTLLPLLIAESLIERVVALESHVVCWIVHVSTSFVNSMLFSVPFGSLWSYCTLLPLLIAELLESHVVCWIVYVSTNFVNSMLFSVLFGSLWSYCTLLSIINCWIADRTRGSFRILCCLLNSSCFN
jgi:hypothetical protein